MIWQRMKKYIYIILGSLMLALGAVGIILPVLPTTPFLLVAGFFYLRSSKRLYGWLLRHRILGPYIVSYLKYKAIPRKTKISALVLLWSSLIVSMVVLASLKAGLFLAAVGVAVSVHLLSLRTISVEEMESVKDWS